MHDCVLKCTRMSNFVVLDFSLHYRFEATQRTRIHIYLHTHNLFHYILVAYGDQSSGLFFQCTTKIQNNLKIKKDRNDVLFMKNKKIKKLCISIILCVFNLKQTVFKSICQGYIRNNVARFPIG